MLQSLTEQVIDDHKYLTTIIEYWFANNFHSLTERPPSSYQARERSSAITKVKQNVETQIQLKAGVILLEMTMPNGKLLRDCTGAECSKLSSKIGGWLLRISKRVRPTQTVGSVLNEDQVRQLYAKS